VKTVLLSEGQCVIEQGAESQDVYWIESGEVEVSCNGVVVASLGQHECFGEMAALDGGKRSATVRGRRSGSLLQLSHLDFLDALDLNPPLYRELIGLVSKRLRHTSARDPRQRA
jgi:CRP-like cAMP-binding protein